MQKLLVFGALLLGCARPAYPTASAEAYWPSNGSRYDDPGSPVRFVPQSAKGYKLSRRCAQGPLTLTLPALGDPFGEYVMLEFRGPRHVVGKWKAVTNAVTWQGTFDTGAPPQNERCVAPEQTLAVPAPGAPGAPASTPNVGLPASGAPGGGGEVVVFVDASLPPRPSAAFGFTIPLRLDGKLTVGSSITITLWSDRPNDWDDYLVWAEQGRLQADDPVKWKAAHDAKVEAETKVHADGSAKVDRENACMNQWDGKKVWTPECEAEFPGLPGIRDKQLACWDVWKAKKVWTDECRKLTNLDPTNGNTEQGPPPQAPPDPQPPKPSIHAEWIPGSHHWSIEGKIWIWSPGVWSVPKSDVDTGQTAKAPQAPPPPKPESPPPKPVPSAVWTPGWWAFHVSGWLWIDGAWRVPPFPGAVWRPYVWVSASIGVTLVPGGWGSP